MVGVADDVEKGALSSLSRLAGVPVPVGLLIALFGSFGKRYICCPESRYSRYSIVSVIVSERSTIYCVMSTFVNVTGN
jgi:hypothetical protein